MFLERHRKILYSSMALVFAVAVALPPTMGMSVDIPSFGGLLGLVGVLAVFIPYCSWRNMDRLRDALETTVATMMFATPLLIFSYLAMRFSLPLTDNALAAADAALGLDSRAIVFAVDKSPVIAGLLGISYASFTPQLLILPFLLSVMGHGARAHLFAVAFVILGTISTALSAFFPSVGAFAHYGIGKADLVNMNGFYGYHFLESFNAVRSAAHYTVSLDSASGIVTFPSVHAGLAVLCAWAGWQSRFLRWPCLILNLCMFVAAITHGAHYVVDIMAGAVIALISISFATWAMVGRSAVRSGIFPTAPRAVPAGAGEAR